MAGDGKENGRDVCREGGKFGENELGGRGWKGKKKGCLKGGCSGRGWQGKVLKGAWKGANLW